MVESLDCLTIFSSTQEKIQTVGFVGVGAMGDPMSAQIAATGFRTLIHDADPARAEQLAAADERTAADLDAIAAADAVVLMLPNSDVVEAVLLDEGLLERMAPGTVLIDMSSSDARRTVELDQGNRHEMEQVPVALFDRFALGRCHIDAGLDEA